MRLRRSPLSLSSRALLCAALLLALAPAAVSAQALTSITSLRVGYSTRKVTAKPTGELKAQLDSVDRELATASALGQTGEVRRLLARGNALLSGRAWTDSADYNSSLLLRTERTVVESQKPYAVRLEQLYQPSIKLTHSLSAHATLTGRPTGATTQPFTTVKDFGVFDGVSRDLRESPFLMELDVHDVPDGRYTVVVQLSDSGRMVGSASLPVVIRKGIDETMSQLEAAAARAPEALRAEILFPVDRMRNVNRGRLELRTFDVDKDVAAALAVAASLRTGKDPFVGRTGDIKRHYALAAAGEIMPYRLYVPTRYKPSESTPVIVALHGLGGTEDSFFDSYGRKLPQLAEEAGYIIAAPLGYRVDGAYGWGTATPPSDPVVRRSAELSEQDVMGVLAQVRKLYNIDANRIYLLGHSMGAIGAWKIAPKFPDIWAAVAAFSGQGAPATAELMRRIPNFVVHGDADATVNVRGSRTMVEAMKALNMEVEYVEVPGGSHSGVVEPNLAGAIRFFTAHKKGRVE